MTFPISKMKARIMKRKRGARLSADRTCGFNCRDGFRDSKRGIGPAERADAGLEFRPLRATTAEGLLDLARNRGGRLRHDAAAVLHEQPRIPLLLAGDHLRDDHWSARGD